MRNLQQMISAKIPQTLVAQRIEGRKNLQHFCNKKPRNCPKIPQNTASGEALFFQEKAKKNLGTIVIPRFSDGARYRTRTCDPMHVKHVL